MFGYTLVDDFDVCRGYTSKSGYQDFIMDLHEEVL